MTSAGTVSSVSYDSNTSEYLVSSSDGKLAFINGADVRSDSAHRVARSQLQVPVAALHLRPGAQSPLPAQGATLQARPAHPYGEQLVVAPATQRPLPLQADAASRFAPPLQDAAPQTVVAP